MNKTVPQSPVSPQPPSRASSESETQSVTDEQPTTMSSFAMRLAKAAKKKDVKEPDANSRPPWRATAKPKKEPNTNALLKAKLLDASRRAVRAMKNNSVSCQTDFQPTIVMKEVGFNVQTDLIGQRDVGILTDGSITVRNIPPGTFFFTHSVSQMTEIMNSTDSGTQTAFPTSRIGSLLKFSSSDTFENLEKALEVNAEKIKAQAEDLRDCDGELDFINRSYLRRRPSMSLDPEAIERFQLLLDSAAEKDDDDDEEDEDEDEYRRPGVRVQQFNLQNSSTHSHWDNLGESSDEEEYESTGDYVRDQRRKSIERENNLFIRTRLRNMTLAPVVSHHRNKRPSLGWSGWDASQNRVIEEFLTQVSDLFDIFDEISILLGPDLRFIREIPATVDMEVPPLKCSLVIKKSRENLSEKLDKIKKLPLDCDRSLSRELLRYAQ
ncbi:uncharacterized protein LOC129794144 [Lutzomyia longipalpis]|uniref:uncharacterized protein LOC129794144 n=1 Tax=Lutzomyia longipalpis TaxID=7200 RepID=UPI0024844497|nr:uncharacterized protein LOC129794144 [Lutzomyia longipalpis]